MNKIMSLPFLMAGAICVVISFADLILRFSIIETNCIMAKYINGHGLDFALATIGILSVLMITSSKGMVTKISLPIILLLGAIVTEFLNAKIGDAPFDVVDIYCYITGSLIALLIYMIFIKPSSHEKKWESYRKEVSDSRELVIIPAIIDGLSGVSGIGIDVGCGDGDLTEVISAKFKCTIFGVDINERLIDKAAAGASNSIFIVGDLSNRAIRKIGVKFDFCFSNCFFNHLDNHSAIACIDDLHSSLRDGAKVLIIVPHWRRAAIKYSSVSHYPYGVSAIPEYGDRQFFRYGEWYCNALVNSGFKITGHETINVPEALRESRRYGPDVGKPLFSIIIAEAIDDVKSLGIASKAFDVACDNRKFEIDMLWKRSLFYWGFIATSFVGFGAAEKVNSNISVVFCSFGFLCSVAWSAGNRGSKYWQEYWENKVVLFQNRITGDIFIDHFPTKASIYTQFSARRFSVSKLIMGISDYTVLTWLLILIHKVFKYMGYDNTLPGWIYSMAIGLTISYSIYLYFACKSED